MSENKTSCQSNIVKNINVSNSCRSPNNLLKVEVAHGSDRHLIELHMNDDIRVCHLQNEIAEITGVHPCNQRIY